VASKEALVARVSAFVESDGLWRVEKFAAWAGIPVPSVYYQISLGRIPGVVRFGKTIRIDPEVALPALRDGGPA
jgi:hypothetical protein